MGGYLGYPEYKDSGIEWLGIIPKHWKKSIIGYYFDIQLGKMLQNEPESVKDEEVFYLKALHIQWDKVTVSDLPKMWASPTDKEKYGVSNGDLLICEGGEVGRSNLLSGIKEDCIIQNALHKVRPSNQSIVEYLNYLMRHIADAKWFDLLCNKATISHLTSEKLRAIAFPVPPLYEQKQIAHFLDYKTAQIDALIGKKEALLKKLSEQRSAIITQAVTKGLDPTVPMKDSGIEWLGKIPLNWIVLPIKFTLAMPITDGPHETPELQDEGVSFISAEAIKNDRIDFEKKRGFISIEEHRRFRKKYQPKYGDIYMVKSGATTGNVAKVETNEIFNIWSPLAVLRPNKDKTITEFLFYVIKSKTFFHTVELNWSFGTQQNIGMGVISNINIALPPLYEQKQIAQFLNYKTAQIDKQKDKIKKAIALLKEYRTALITNAVTGKIDVRDIKIPELDQYQPTDKKL